MKERLEGSLWFVPSVMVTGAIGLSVITTLLDKRTEHRPFTDLIFTGGTDSARAILQTVATATITFTALVFTITVVALQLSSQQFSPRVLRTFLRDRQSKFALGMFISTFMFCLMVMRVISGSDDRGITIPSISMMALLVLTLSSVAMFVSYISHMANAIRVSHIVVAVGDEARSLIASLEPRSDTEQNRSLFHQEPTQLVYAPRPGTLTAISHEGLIELAREESVAFRLRPAVGDFIPKGQAIIEVFGGTVQEEAVWGQLTTGIERNMQQDVAFGLRQLVDIAEKALSPSLNDPTTAVVAIDQIHDLLRRLAPMTFPPAEHADKDGIVRLVTQPLHWDALVELAIGEIRLSSGSSLQVVRRLLAVLEDLIDVALPERREALETEKELLKELITRTIESEHDRQVAGAPDAQGIGSRS